MPDMNMSTVASHAGIVAKYLLSNWSLDLGLSIPFILLPLYLYFRGLSVLERQRDREGDPVVGTEARYRIVFLLGMSLLVISMMSPVMYWSMVYLWMHVLFHVLVMIAAPSLIAYGRPWTIMRLGAPSYLGRALDSVVLLSKREGFWMRLFSVITNPWVDLIYFNVVMWAWFVPQMMTWGVDNKYVMLVMHFSFLSAGLMLFVQLIDSPPFRSRIFNPVARIGMSLLAAMSSWVIAMLLGLSIKPWFPVYFHIVGKSMSPMGDQEIGASILWVLCMEPFVYTVYYNIKLWLQMSEDNRFPEFSRLWMKNIRRDHAYSSEIVDTYVSPVDRPGDRP